MNCCPLRTLFKTLYSGLYGGGYPFDELAEKVVPIRYENQLTELNSALVLWGGEDISPWYYKEKATEYTSAPDLPSKRDEQEEGLFRAAVRRGIPVIGICRGAQLACALLGGRLFQHVDAHTQYHPIETKEKKRLIASSLHHQMMVPERLAHHEFGEVDFELLAWTSPKPRSSVYVRGQSQHSDEKKGEVVTEHPCGVEPEVVLWPKQKVLGIQGHPEFMKPDCEFVTYSLDLVKAYLL